MSTKTNALTVIDAKEFPVLAGGNVAELFAQNLAGETIGPEDLTRIKVPAGGGTTWEIEDESTKSIEGVVIHIARRRAMWSNPNPTGDPPDCFSMDCVHGEGKPGGLCADCPLNAWGTQRRPDGTNGRGKACRESKLLFLVRKGQYIPEVLTVPPGSLKVVKQFQLSLVKRNLPYFAVVSRLELEKAVNKDGIGFARIKPSIAGVLSPEDIERVRSLARELQAVFAQVRPEAEDLAGDEGEPVEV